MTKVELEKSRDFWRDLAEHQQTETTESEAEVEQLTIEVGRVTRELGAANITAADRLAENEKLRGLLQRMKEHGCERCGVCPCCGEPMHLGCVTGCELAEAIK